MPSPVSRIAPKPRRCTEICPPSETSPAKLAESSFLLMIGLQNSSLNPIPRLHSLLQAFNGQLPKTRNSSLLSSSLVMPSDTAASSQATVGWRRCRRTDDSFYKVQTALLPPPLPFLREAHQLGKSPSVENYGQLGELAEESRESRSR